MSLNLNAMMKKLAMGKAWEAKRMKSIRFSFVNLPGRVFSESRSLVVRLSRHCQSFDLLINARKRIAMLNPLPSG